MLLLFLSKTKYLKADTINYCATFLLTILSLYPPSTLFFLFFFFSSFFLSFLSFFFFFLFFFSFFFLTITYFVAPRFIFKRNMSHNYFVQNVVADGGEGIILRKCGSLYEPGRSYSLLKIKVFCYLF